MADVNRGDRPLSPHASIYRWPLNAILSIGHRVSGVCLAVTAVLVVWWFLAASTSPSYFAVADGALTSPLGDVVLALSALAIWYHFCNGLRHLIWDTGSWFGKRRTDRSGKVVLVAAVALAAFTLYIA